MKYEVVVYKFHRRSFFFSQWSEYPKVFLQHLPQAFLHLSSANQLENIWFNRFQVVDRSLHIIYQSNKEQV